MEATKDFFKRVDWGLFDVFSSAVVAGEIAAAPEPRRAIIEALVLKVSPQMLLTKPEVERLAGLYVQRRALPLGSRADAFHVALATYYGMDALLSWNFKHLANINRHRRLMAINVSEGYNRDLSIVTPLEVLDRE
jgi:hypothetical protein